MSFGDWSKVEEDYKLYSLSRYAEHAKGMLSLIPRIKDDIRLAEVLPGTSLSVLFLVVQGHETQVRVWCVRSDMEYEVYLYHPGEGGSERVTVDNEQVVPTIVGYIEKLRSEI